ncbi:BON domain-containing protein [Polaromonas naphthalenivorans]|nr:BON domain-containing protein [Polaromonas naphthalenivorans]
MRYLNIKFSPLSAALVLSAACLLGCSVLQAGEQAASAPGDPALAAAVTQAIHDALDYKAKDIQVAVNGGVVMLSGWANQPSDESRARAVASRVPGVMRAYSRVHLWSSDDSY